MIKPVVKFICEPLIKQDETPGVETGEWMHKITK